MPATPYAHRRAKRAFKGWLLRAPRRAARELASRLLEARELQATRARHREEMEEQRYGSYTDAVERRRVEELATELEKAWEGRRSRPRNTAALAREILWLMKEKRATLEEAQQALAALGFKARRIANALRVLQARGLV